MDQLLIVPEFILIDGLRKGLSYIIQDFKDQTANATPEKSWLYLVCGNAQFERYNYYKQAQAVLIKEQDDPRLLTIDLMFNMKIDGAPHIYISLPAEQYNQRGNALGIGEGLGMDNYVFNDFSDYSEYRAILTHRKGATYNIVITSDNVNEVVLLYHILTALITSLQTHFSLKGLENFTFSGRDIEPNSDLMPTNLFIRAISIGLEYNTKTVGIPPNIVAQDFDFTGKPVQ